MTFGLAMLLIFVLYLIDKHNRWRQVVNGQPNNNRPLMLAQNI